MSIIEGATAPTTATIGDLIREYGKACEYDRLPDAGTVAEDLDYLSRLDASNLATVGDLHVICRNLDLCPGGGAHWGSGCTEHDLRGEVAR